MRPRKAGAQMKLHSKLMGKPGSGPIHSRFIIYPWGIAPLSLLESPILPGPGSLSSGRAGRLGGGVLSEAHGLPLLAKSWRRRLPVPRRLAGGVALGLLLGALPRHHDMFLEIQYSTVPFKRDLNNKKRFYIDARDYHCRRSSLLWVSQMPSDVTFLLPAGLPWTFFVLLVCWWWILSAFERLKNSLILLNFLLPFSRLFFHFV